MRILYPWNPLKNEEADEPFCDEYLALSERGVACSLFDYDRVNETSFRLRAGIETGEHVLYRGWMLNTAGYEQLVSKIERCGAKPVTSLTQFLNCHHLPNWYTACAPYTAVTHFFDNDDELENNAAALGWARCFVKDYVKSNTADLGSIASSAEQVREIVNQIEFFRGEIEGGVAIREVEDYVEGSERRYFVKRGVPYSSDGAVPAVVTELSGKIDSPFFSVDIIEDRSGELRLVELGDGQVSERKEWSLDSFVKVLAADA